MPNFLFFSGERKADLNSFYGTKGRNYKVRGLLNILSSFNFTIDENSPDDADIALDPELLGRVFENLLASFNPETSTTARKATGSYNTPREIVDYMVTESLEEYFKTHLTEVQNIDEKLEKLFSTGSNENPLTKTESKKLVELIESVRIVDPAVGSGAFPMGALNRMVFILNKVDPGNELWKQAQLDAAEAIPDPQVRRNTKKQIEEFFKDKNADYGRKLYLIQKCIYGVDIQQIAVEIAKLRFFISLLVDEKIDKTKPNWDIQPLPNLDFKIVQGNSLIELLSPDLVRKGADIEKNTLIDKLNELKGKLFDAYNPKVKQNLRAQINKLVIKIVNYEKLIELKRLQSVFAGFKQQEKLLEIPGDNLDFFSGHIDKKRITKLTKEIEELEKIKNTAPENHFEWHLNFNEVFKKNGGFDVVIANPPYIGEKGHKKLFHEVKQHQLGKYYLGKMDYFYFFFHLALDLGKPDVQIAFITTSYYPTALGARKLRQDFKQRTIIRHLINFNELKLFEAAQGQHNMITILEKGQDENAVVKTAVTQRQGVAKLEILHQILSWEDLKTIYYEIKQKDLYEGKEYYLRFDGNLNTKELSPIQSILNKLKNGNGVLSDYTYINSGCDVTISKITPKHLKTFKGNFTKGDSVFVLTDKEIRNLTPNDRELKILKSFIKNSSIFKYGVKTGSERLIYLRWKDDIDKYPNIKKHLSKFKQILRDQSKRYSENYPWYALHRPRNQEIFEAEEKILVPYRNKSNVFGYSKKSIYSSRDVFYITAKGKNVALRYILSLLNSKLYFTWLYYRGKRKGETLELYQKPLSEIPIKKIPIEEQKPFIDLVDKILAITKNDNYLESSAKQAKVREYEKQIDRLVYKLYALTSEEIEIVEGSK